MMIPPPWSTKVIEYERGMAQEAAHAEVERFSRFRESVDWRLLAAGPI